MANKDGYGHVNTDQSNDIFSFVEQFGSHDQQYAILLGSMIGIAKAMGIEPEQVHADISANWQAIPAPQIIAEC